MPFERLHGKKKAGCPPFSMKQARRRRVRQSLKSARPPTIRVALFATPPIKDGSRPFLVRPFVEIEASDVRCAPSRNRLSYALHDELLEEGVHLFGGVWHSPIKPPFEHHEHGPRHGVGKKRKRD
jgi:hypothetical protein